MRILPSLTLFCAAIASLPAIAPATAEAATLPFTGSSYNVNPPAAPGAPCEAPLLNLSFGPDGTGGSSNFGDFTFSQAHCAVGGPGPYSGGVFEYFFAAGDTLSGTYSGILAATSTAGLLSNTINYVVTGGTGRFLNASGTIQGIGTLDFRNGPARANLALNGTLDLPGVPEPATWAMMIGGFGLAGSMVRRQRRQDVVQAI
jgi:hypothetical protein